MSGFFKRYSRAALLTLVFMGASMGFAALASPGHAAAAGTITGGKYYFDVQVNGQTTKYFIDSQNSTVSLDGATNPAPGSSVSDNGVFTIPNVAAGTHTVTINFSTSSTYCALPRVVRIFESLAGGRCVNTQGTRTFGGIIVKDGQTAFSEGTDTTTERKADTAIRLDADGNPILECHGDFLVEWVMCPMVRNMFRAMDLGLRYIIQPFLTVTPLQPNDTSGVQTPLYTIWDNIRNFVNIGFILVFFVIIFSQATSFGVSNYGVKRLLPRLIGIAILTNLSFYLCAILVDISNILGAGVSSLVTSAVLHGNATIDLSGSALLDGGVIAAFMAVLYLAPIAIVAVFIFIMIGFVIFIIAAVTILLRQIFLIFLIVISPLALLAAILPNTSRFASQWFSLFMRLLLMYPLIMLLFALGKIASAVLSQAGGISG